MSGLNDSPFKLNEDKIAREVNLRRVAVFNDRAIAAAYSSPLGTLLLAWIAAYTAGWQAAVAWLCVINLCELLLLGVAHYFPKREASEGVIKNWARCLVLGEMLIGLAWGSSVWFFWSDGHFLTYLLNLTVLAAVAGICVVVMSPSRSGLFLFMAGVLLMPVLHLNFVTHDYEVEAALGFLIMFAVVLQYGQVAGRQLIRGLQGEVRAEELAAELSRRTEALEQSHVELNLAQAAGHIGSWVYDRTSSSIRLSPEACRLFSQPPGSVVSASDYLGLTHELDRPAMLDAWRQAVISGVFEHEHRIDTGNGHQWFKQKARLEFSAAGDWQRAVGTSQNITQSKEAEAALRESEERFRTLIEWSPECICVLRGGKIIYLNAAALRALGATAASEMVGRPYIDFVHPSFRATALSRAATPLRPGESHPMAEERFLRANGEPFHAEFQSIGILFDGKPAVQLAFRDVTERKAAADLIEHLAFYDALTELPNRRLMLDRLGLALTQSARHASCGAVMMIDLDNFKSLNDSLGHAVGDQLLIAVAARLKQQVRQGDTVARLGGDEFVIVLNDLGEQQVAAVHAEEVASSILRELRQPFALTVHPDEHDGGLRHHHCSASIGITVFKGSAVPIDELMKRSDVAMYHAKASGRSTLRFYDPALQGAVEARATLEADMRRAIQDGDFVLHYQAQVNALGVVEGVEALLRWQHPTRGLLEPADFIPLAEETGLILTIGDWVLKKACTQLALWAKQPALAALSIAVNVSARQFAQSALGVQIQAMLRETGAPAANLKLELTESTLIHDADEANLSMRALKALGIKISLDDFGMGYSSLAYLKNLPIDQLKIDQSFVQDIEVNKFDCAIARTVLTLGQSLGLEIIAEGVEQRGQRDMLVSLGCKLFQGYFFARPMPVEGFEAWMQELSSARAVAGPALAPTIPG